MVLRVSPLFDSLIVAECPREIDGFAANFCSDSGFFHFNRLKLLSFSRFFLQNWSRGMLLHLSIRVWLFKGLHETISYAIAYDFWLNASICSVSATSELIVWTEFCSWGFLSISRCSWCFFFLHCTMLLGFCWFWWISETILYFWMNQITLMQKRSYGFAGVGVLELRFEKRWNMWFNSI